MTARPTRLPLGIAGALLLGVPGAIALACWIGALLAIPARGDLGRESARLEAWFSELADLARATAEGELRGALPVPRGRVAERLRGRLEGIAIVGADGRPERWTGAPAEIACLANEPYWEIRVEGVRTRLVVQSAPDGDGRSAVASFVVDSELRDKRVERLLPRGFARAAHVELEFVDRSIEPPAATDPPEAAGLPATRLLLRAPSGGVLARATIEGVPVAHRRERVRDAGLAWAAVAFILLLAWLPRWGAIVVTLPGAGLALAAVAVGRGALLWTDAASLLLSRELGSARCYGSTTAWGLLASPADLALTGLALWLASRAVSRLAGSGTLGRPAARLLAGGGALLATVAVPLLASSIASNSRLPLLDRPGLWPTDGRALILAGLSLALLGPAELWATLRETFGTRASRPRARPRTRTVAVAFVILAAGASVHLQQLLERVALERVASELAPQVLEQGARRRLALTTAVGQVQEQYRCGWPEGVPARFLAHHFWSRSELFHAGFRSSLDFYTPAGDRVSHFGFGLPPLDELPQPAAGSLPVEVRAETFNPASIRESLLHAEARVIRDGESIGVVVGHVLDEPSNLPFLPGAQPYLAALGPGSPGRTPDDLSSGPHYVLYDAAGEVLQSSVPQPPARTVALLDAAAAGRSIDVRTGSGAYVALPLAQDDRLHLLLVPAWTRLERLSHAVRLTLCGLVLAGLLALLPRLLRRGRLAGLAGALFGSLHHKLLAALLVASVLPLVGLALFLQNYLEQRGDAAVFNTAVRFARTAQRVLEDYAALQVEEDPDAEAPFNDEILYWLRGVVGQEIHVFESGTLLATSKRELFDSGLLPERLDGEVARGLLHEGLPDLARPARIGSVPVTVGYAPLRRGGGELVVAVPISAEPQRIEREVDRIVEILLLVTVLLVGLLAVVAARVARTVARPVRELVEATGRVAAGDYETRLEATTRDEVADLVRGFNGMAGSLAAQRADLERRREYMERLLRHATTGVVSTDAAGRILTLNPAALDLLAPAAAGLRVGEPWLDALRASEALRPLAARLDRADLPFAEPFEIDLERDGTPARLRVVRLRLPDPAGASGSLVLLDDVTDLMRSNQLAAWAEMARAIAHEIKNPLTPIQLSTEHLERLLRDRGALPAPEIEACLATVFKQVRTLQEISREFSAYAMLPSLSPAPLDPVEFMRETLAPYRSAPPRGVEVDERYRACPVVPIDRRVLSRAVVNLVENALQAMPDGGRLTVAVTPGGGGREVQLDVADTGVGLAPDVRRRLFEMYFSTKSSGTGLGLAIVRRAVEAHHGTIEVESEPGRGTRFRIRLPVPPEALAVP